MKPGDEVARLDRNLDSWGQAIGYRAYIVEAISPSGSRVTLRSRHVGALVCLTKKTEIDALVPLTPEIEAEISRDTEWLKARRQAMDLHDQLQTWVQRRPDSREQILEFLKAAEPLRRFFWPPTPAAREEK